MKHLIFSNDVNEMYDSIVKNKAEYFEDEEPTENQIWDMVNENIEDWLNDEKVNLDGIGENGIVTIVSLKLWNGTRQGIMFSDNLAEALDNLPIADCTFEWEVDGYNMIGRLWHHDDPMGNTTMIVRELKDGVTIDKVNLKNWKRLTKSVKKPVAEVFGW